MICSVVVVTVALWLYDYDNRQKVYKNFKQQDRQEEAVLAQQSSEIKQRLGQIKKQEASSSHAGINTTFCNEVCVISCM